jgi:rare lipoprotein A
MRKLCSSILVALLCGCAAATVCAQTGESARHEPTRTSRHHPDRSMRPQLGKASIYADKFANRKMANGRRMNPHGDNAASKTLPLGTRALVTNLQTGQSAVVTIEDRGPYVDGRIVDLSPATAEKIGLARRQGIAPVEVRPLELPPPDGAVASADEVPAYADELMPAH